MRYSFIRIPRRLLSMVLVFAMAASVGGFTQASRVVKAAAPVTLELAQSGTFPFAGAVKDVDWGGVTGTPDLENQFIANGGAGMWIRWKNIDLQGGIGGWVMSYAKGNAAETRNFEVLVSKPGAAFSEAKSLGVQSFNAINTGSWNTNPTSAPQYTVGSPLLDGVCDVFIRTVDGSWNFRSVSLNLNDVQTVTLTNIPQPRALGVDYNGGSAAGGAMNPNDGAYVGNIQGSANGDSWIRYTGVDIPGHIASFQILYSAPNLVAGRRTEVWIADAGEGIDKAVKVGAADTSAPSGGWTTTPPAVAECTDIAPHHGGTNKTIFVRFYPGTSGAHDLNYQSVILTLGAEQLIVYPTVTLKSLTQPANAPWSGTAYYESHGAGNNEGTVGIDAGDMGDTYVGNLSGANSWIRYNDVDLKAGVLKFDITYASGGTGNANTRIVDVYAAKADNRIENTVAAPGQASTDRTGYAQRGVPIPAAADGTPNAGSGFYYVGRMTSNQTSSGWNGPGVTVTVDPANLSAYIGGKKDVYIRLTDASNFNFGGMLLTLKDGAFADPVDPISPDYSYTESLPARPAAADVAPYLRTYQDAPASTANMAGDSFANSGATPIGNGYMGATVYGGVLDDMILTNEKTLWSGGPGAVTNYTGGMIPGKAADAQVSLEKVRNIVDQQVNAYAPGSPTGTYPDALITSADASGRGVVATEITNNLFGTRDGFGSYQELSRIHLLDNLAPSPAPAVDTTKIAASDPGSGTETVGNIFKTGTDKWFVGSVPTAAAPIWVMWGYGEAVSFTQYNIQTANDMENRDPKSWKLYGSNTEGVTGGSDAGWTLLDDVADAAMPSARNTAKLFTMSPANADAGKPYKYYRLVVTANKGGGQFQISGIFPVFGGAAPPAESSLYSNYRRELNLETGITTVTYDYKAPGDTAATKFRKEYFMDYPDNVMVMKMSADKPFDQRVTLETIQTKGVISVDTDKQIIQLTGQPADQRADGLSFFQQIKVYSPTAGSTVTAVGGGLKAANTQELIVVMAAGTNYKPDYTDSFNFLRNKDAAFNDVKQRLSSALALGYNKLLDNHLNDYQALFGRVDFKIDGVTVPAVTTSSLVGSSGNNYNNASTNDKRYIEMLYYQFGRYLLIASSREGSLPANLQGVWASSLDPPWEADYHTNVNLEMNYWPAETANLEETNLPMLEYVAMQAPRGRLVAQEYHHTPNTDDGFNNKGGLVNRGWTSYHVNNIWGHAGPENYWEGAYAPAGGTWISLDIWQNYLFNHDKTILQKYYDVLMDAAIFWVDNLWTDTATGKLVASPSYSPEHGPYTFGTTFDQGVIWEIFQDAQDAFKVMGVQGKYDAAFVKEIADAQSNLLLPDVNGVPNIKGFRRTGIGSAGQFMEWPYESRQDVLGTDDPPATGTSVHRHANQLFMLHPGSFIVPGRSASDDVFANAMKQTLTVRTDDGTGWSRAWKMNFWARLRDGDHALNVFAGLLNSSTLPQLLDTHAPFQIDGNFGATAGVDEMLLQSQGGYIEFLPALPAAWNNGHAYGLKARGGVVVDMDWHDGKITRAVLKPGSDGPITVKYPSVSTVTVRNKANQIINAAIDGSGTITISGAAGEEYTLTPGAALTTSTAAFQILPADAANVVIKVKGASGTAYPETVVPAGGRLELPNGDYQYAVTASNYAMDAIVSPTFAIANGDKLIDIKLAATDFTVTFSVTPPAAADTAQITVKDAAGATQVPTAPGVYQLANGQYSYTAAAAGYADKTGTFTVSGGGLPVNLAMDQLFDVTFTITPADAATNAVVTVAGQTETARNAFRLINGTYAYTVVSSTPTAAAPGGYIKKTGAFTVSGGNLNVAVPEMLAYTGQYEVTFNVTPSDAASGAKITIQDAASGRTLYADSQDTLFYLSPGKYGYIVANSAYITKMGFIDVVDGNLTVDAPMSPAPSGQIRLYGINGGYFNTGNNGVLNQESTYWTGMIRPLTWIKYPSTNIAGGIDSYTVTLARGNGTTTAGFDVRIAPPGAPFSEAVSIGGFSQDIFTNGWGAPGIDITRSGSQILPHLGGTYDVYAVITAGEINFGGMYLTLKPMPTEKQSYNVSFSTRPDGAAVALTALDGTPVSPAAAGGKTYFIPEGFYKYTVSAAGFGSTSDYLILDTSKSVTIALLPDTGSFSQSLEAEDAVITNGSVISNPAFSGGKGAGNFTASAAIGSIDGTFSNISNARFTVPRDDTGVVPVNIYYSSNVTADGQAYIAVKSGGGGIKQVALNPAGVSTVFVDMRGLPNNILYVSNVVSPANGITVSLDRIALHSVTIPGSVEPGQDDAPYAQPVNPIIKSIFTADPEMHVWPSEPDKIYIYPSHDIYPSAGCDRMDQYHVYSTTDMKNFTDQGEILRYQDIADAKADTSTNLWKNFYPTSTDASGNRRTFMWAPDIAYKDGWYYFYWPVPLDINNTQGLGDWGSTWVTGVVRSRYPDRDFEQIPEKDAYPGWKGYIEGMPSVIDVSVRVYDGQAYICVGGGQKFYQGMLEDNMVQLKEPYRTNGLLQVTDSNGTPAADTAYDHVLRPSSILQRLPNFHEGPSVFERTNDYGEKWYYLIYPGGYNEPGKLSGDGFHYAMSKDPFGFNANGDNGTTWQYKGVFFDAAGWDTIHGSLLDFKGQAYLVYHTADLSGDGTLRSVCMDDIQFNPDGTIVRRGKSLTGPTAVQGAPAYVRPGGTVFSVKDDAVITGDHTVYRDTASGGDNYVVSDMSGSGTGATTITINGVDGGGLNPNGKGNRAMLVFNYSTASNLPKMRLTVNGTNYAFINFPKTGGRSFFAEAEFTTKALNPGPNNTIVLNGLAEAGQGFVLNSVEVILFDDSGQAGLTDISADARVTIEPVSIPGQSDSDFNPRFSVTAKEDIALKLVVAQYDAAGRLAAINSNSTTLKAGGKAELQASIPYTNKAGTYKFFIWDSSFVPLTAVNDVSALQP